MRYLVRLAGMAVLSLMLAGCSGGTELDFTDRKTLEDSLQSIEKELSPEDMEKLFSVMQSISKQAMKDLGINMFSPGPDANAKIQNVLFEKLDGLTGKEVIDKYWEEPDHSW